jgi:catechol 2,3-dioxygenase-like lactoylglutathione lyase family enzyme
MIQTHGFLHITIGVTDLDRATAFYRDLLGCELLRMNRTRTMSFMKTGERFFVLTVTGQHVPPNPAGPPTPATTRFHHAFTVSPETLAEARTLFEAHRIPYAEGTDPASDERRIVVHDPDGNGVALVAVE